MDKTDPESVLELVSESGDSKEPFKNVTEADKIIIEHLFERHRTSLTSCDSMDLKLAQLIGLNGLILSFILIKSPDVKNLFIYLIGIYLLISAIILGILGIRSRDWCAGANIDFFKDWKNKFSSEEGLDKLKGMLSDDIEENKNILTEKAGFCNYMLYFNIVGLIIVIIGYYYGG
jgi:hypothetical protein